MILRFHAEESLEAHRETIEAAGYTPFPIIAQDPKPPHFTLQHSDGIYGVIGIRASFQQLFL